MKDRLSIMVADATNADAAAGRCSDFILNYFMSCVKAALSCTIALCELSNMVVVLTKNKTKDVVVGGGNEN